MSANRIIAGILLVLVLIFVVVSNRAFADYTSLYNKLAPLTVPITSKCTSPQYTNQYDRHIRAAVFHFWDIEKKNEWCYWKSQLIAESNLDPNAKSWAKAEGIAQFMPATWAEESERLDVGAASPYDAYVAILVGANYMNRLGKFWHKKGRTPIQHLQLQQASYNAGAGNIYKSQIACKMAHLWDDIKQCLHKITGRHSEETIGYVARIERIRERLTK